MGSLAALEGLGDSLEREVQQAAAARAGWDSPQHRCRHISRHAGAHIVLAWRKRPEQFQPTTMSVSQACTLQSLLKAVLVLEVTAFFQNKEMRDIQR